MSMPKNGSGLEKIYPKKMNHHIPTYTYVESLPISTEFSKYIVN